MTTRMNDGPHRVIIEADGGSRGNPGPAAYGAVLKDADTGEVIAEDGTTLGRATNNVAEYSGLIAGLKLAEEFAPDADIEVLRRRATEQAERLGRLQAECDIPIVVLTRGTPHEILEHFQHEAYRNGVAAFPTIHRAARAISVILEWRARRTGLPEIF